MWKEDVTVEMLQAFEEATDWELFGVRHELADTENPILMRVYLLAGVLLDNRGATYASSIPHTPTPEDPYGPGRE